MSPSPLEMLKKELHSNNIYIIYIYLGNYEFSCLDHFIDLYLEIAFYCRLEKGVRCDHYYQQTPHQLFQE
jgi:hypothetical protein